MTDLEQIRRDAERWSENACAGTQRMLARHSLVLLAELEQAEQRAYDWEWQHAQASKQLAHLSEVYKNEMLARQQAERERDKLAEALRFLLEDTHLEPAVADRIKRLLAEREAK